MAFNSTVLEDMDDKFLQCSVCLNQLQEPKILPCLHRYCKECLSTFIKENSDQFPCPECREQCTIPPEGVDGFKTDFFVKKLTEYITSTKTKLATSKASNLNVVNSLESSVDLLDFQDLFTKLQETSVKGDVEVMCSQHRDKVAEACCVTCQRLPVCLMCIIQDHCSHEFVNASILAEADREILDEQLRDIKVRKNEVLSMLKELDVLRKCNNEFAHEEKKIIQCLYERKSRNISSLIKETQRSYGRRLSARQARKDIIKQLENEKKALDVGHKNNMKFFDEHQEFLNNKLEDVSKAFSNLIERFDDLTTMAAIFENIGNVWSVVRWMPLVSRALCTAVNEGLGITLELAQIKVSLSDQFERVQAFSPKRKIPDRLQMVRLGSESFLLAQPEIRCIEDQDGVVTNRFKVASPLESEQADENEVGTRNPAKSTSHMEVREPQNSHLWLVLFAAVLVWFVLFL